MQPKRYRMKPVELWAMKWDKSDPDPTLNWLESNGITYTYHEINSGGELMIQTSAGYAQVGDNCYIMVDGNNNVGTSDPETFRMHYQEV